VSIYGKEVAQLGFREVEDGTPKNIGLEIET
jgi:hypothetical protein